MARRHGTKKTPPPHAPLHREHNDAATHETRKDVSEISMLHPRKEHNGDKTRITRKGKAGKEQGARSKYVTMSCHTAHTREATSARPAPPTQTRKNRWPSAREWLSRGANGPAPVQSGATVTTLSYSTTTLFVALIRTYTLMHSVLSRLCFASSHTLLHSKIKRMRTLRLGGKSKIDQSLSPSQVCCMSRRARGKDNEQRWPKRCVEPCRVQVGYKPMPNNAR